MTSSDEIPNGDFKLDKSIEESKTRNSLIKTVIILAVVIAVVIVVEVVLEYKTPWPVQNNFEDCRSSRR